ncbi:MAG: hypothetical protein ACKVW3_06290 [Phycisphaerales bacterium]
MSRELIAPCAIGLAICLGGYMVLVEPVANRLHASRAELVALSTLVREGEVVLAQSPELTRAANEAREQAKAIEEQSRLAKDERALFAAITSLAGYHGVRVEQVSSARQETHRAPATTPTARPVVSTDHSLTLAGAYADLVPFLRAVRTDLGYVMIVSARITPKPEPGAVRVDLVLRHFAFDASPILAPDAAQEPKP